MRGPEEMEKTADSSNRAVQGEDERDPCSSPPCKRFKQAVLNFPSTPTNSSNLRHSDSCGGLVTATTSPPISSSNDDEIIIIDSTLQKTPTTSPISNKDKLTHNTSVRQTSAEKKKNKDERERIREVKKKEREEKLKQKEEAKAAKERERMEVKQKKQAEREKREKDRFDKKLKEEKERQEKKEKREEERRKKEEEQNAKLEEKRRKEEEKRHQEEDMERKKLKAMNSFKSFFTKTTTFPKTLPKSLSKFEPFEVKPFMSLAPVHRINMRIESKDKLDSDLKSQSEAKLYMDNLQHRKPLPVCKAVRRRRIAHKTPCDNHDTSNKEIIEVLDNDDDEDDDDDDNSSESSSVIGILDNTKKPFYMKAVFFKFCENNRPPYYGTQRKASTKISPRNPFRKDETKLSYEVDSDDEWEEEEPGESLLDSEPEDNEEDNEEVDEEDEDGWMVPHGYLSDDEGIDQNDDDGDDDVQQEQSCDKKEQQLAKAKAWERELKKKRKLMKPVCVGCVWPNINDVSEVLKRFEACVLVDGPSININTVNISPDDMQTSDIGIHNDTGSSTAMYVPDEAMTDLISFVHGNTDGLDKLVNSFRLHWSNKCNDTKAHPMLTGKGHISKRQLNIKIRSIAKKESRLWDKSRWYVLPSTLANYGLEGLKTEVEPQQVNMKTTSISPSGISVAKHAVLQPVSNTIIPNQLVVHNRAILPNNIVVPDQALLSNQTITMNQAMSPANQAINLNQGMSGIHTLAQQSSHAKIPSYTTNEGEQQTIDNQPISINQPVSHRLVLQTIAQNIQGMPSIAVKRQAVNQDYISSKVMKSDGMTDPTNNVKDSIACTNNNQS